MTRLGGGARLAIGVAMLLVAGAPVAAAEPEYPVRAIKLVVTASVGSGPDVSSRILADALRKALGQPVVVENRPGADGIIAERLVAGSPADGYTLLQATNGQIALTPILHESLPFDTERDLAPVAAIARWPLALIVPASLSFQSVQELILYARTHSGSLNYGSASSNYLLAAQMFEKLTGTELHHIPYQGVPAVVNALAAGEVQVAIVNAAAATALINAGRLRALAVNTEKRQPTLPGVPTFAEAGVPGFDFGIWLGMYAPSGMSASVAARLQTAVAAALDSSEVRAKFAALGMTPMRGSPQDVSEMISRDRKAYGAMARAMRDGETASK